MTADSIRIVSLVGGLAVVPAMGGGIVEPETTVPLIQDVDVVVIGGTCAAVAAAESAAQAGAKVFLSTAGLCLGEDIAGTLRVWAEQDEIAGSDLMGRLFLPAGQEVSSAPGRIYTTPLRAKRALDTTLLKAGVRFLTGAYATDVLSDASGLPAGVVLCDRSGRQAIRAKIIIDASPRGMIARLAGAEFTPFPGGNYEVSRVVIAGAAPDCGGTVTRHDRWQPEKDVVQLSSKTTIAPGLYECVFALPFADGGPQSSAEVEQAARDRTFTATQLDAADRVFFVPPDHVIAAAPCATERMAADELNLEALRPTGIQGVYVLGPLADVPRPLANELAKPGFSIRVGARLGRLAASDAKSRAIAGDVRLPARRKTGATADVREVRGTLTQPFVAATGTVKCEASELPVLGDFDLVVAGGGTTGAPAAVCAARSGLNTVVVEQLHELGGVQTAGMICGYYYGNQRGFTREIDAGVAATGKVKSQSKAEWYRRAIRDGKGRIWFGSMVVGAWLEGTSLRGVVVATPDGTRGVIRSRAVIDASGNADVAAAAGEPTEFYHPEELVGQGVGMAVIRLGAGGHNNDYALVDDTDASDLCFFGLRARLMTDGGWDVSQLVNSRERRRIVGVFQVSALDYLTARTFPDTIIQHRSRFDLHGSPSHDFFYTKNIRTANHVTLEANGPYRALLPKTTDGLLVVGLGMSATRDAMAIMRMQADLQNQGYAAACAVRLALASGCELRAIPVRELQRQLVEKGILPESVLGEQDSHPLPDAVLKLASHDVMMGYGGLPYLFADPQRAKPLLLAKYEELSTHTSGRDPEVSLIYAHVLAMLGDPAGVDELAAWVSDHGWDEEWPEDTGSRVNRMESYVLALGRAGSKKAVPAVLAKGRELCDGKKSISSGRCRALGFASVALGDPAFAEMLALLLAQPGIVGHAIRLADPIPPVPGYNSRSNYSQQEKMEVAREINLAAALYRLGDSDGKARTILESYAQDPRGFCANYARLILAKKPSL
ncbi:MAG: FAD-dependent oxidoreductase [Verrucomicrobiae bacterium]|nr:FAD-dependent oxidoreductase [Verrucomicrobiae bacterium]